MFRRLLFLAIGGVTTIRYIYTRGDRVSARKFKNKKKATTQKLEKPNPTTRTEIVSVVRTETWRPSIVRCDRRYNWWQRATDCLRRVVWRNGTKRRRSSTPIRNLKRIRSIFVGRSVWDNNWPVLPSNLNLLVPVVLPPWCDCHHYRNHVER